MLSTLDLAVVAVFFIYCLASGPLLLGAGMGAPLLLRWLWWRVNAAAELAAIGASSVLAPIVLWRIDAEGARLLIMAASTTAVTLIAALASPPEPAERLQAFYRRVEPPGFWGPVAQACGASARAGHQRLRQGLALTASAACGVFSLLVGLGSWLFGSPAPTWFPWRGGWIGFLLLLAAALLGNLWRALRRSPPPRRTELD